MALRNHVINGEVQIKQQNREPFSQNKLIVEVSEQVLTKFLMTYVINVFGVTWFSALF